MWTIPAVIGASCCRVAQQTESKYFQLICFPFSLRVGTLRVSPGLFNLPFQASQKE